MMLINILDAIFTNCEFIKNEVSFGDYSCFFYHNQSKSDFFILLDKNNITSDELILLEESGLNELDGILKQHETVTEAYAKNTTLVLCIHSTEEIEKHDVISSIEEDKYLFKKNIVFYSESETTELQDLFSEDYTPEKANSILQTTGLFENLKTNKNSGYALLTRLFIKLPFLHLEMQHIDLENLSELIEQEAEEKKVDNLYMLNQKQIDINKLSSYKDLVQASFVKEIKDGL
jgi:hypothetical protein